VLFADLSDSTALAAAMEAEHYSELLRAFREACREVIPKHGGTVVRVQGDGVLAMFGFPEALENDGRRATEAALELHQRVRAIPCDAPPPLPGHLSLHSGIHAGLALVDEGDLVRGRFELLGDPPNVAARLSDAAERDEILVSEETLGPATCFFESRRFELAVKGRAHPVVVHRILARAGVSAPFEARLHRGLAPFVSRQRELQTLLGLLEETAGGAAKCAVIVAPPGLGKSRLAEEFLRRAEGMQCDVHRGYCENYLGAEPFRPFLQMLRTLFGLGHDTPRAAATAAVDGVLTAIDPGLLAHRTELIHALSLSDSGSAEDGRRTSAARTVTALCAVFDRIATRRPAVVFIDDVQWADDATRQVIAAVRTLAARSLMLLLAHRGPEPAEAGLRDATIIELVPFGHDEAVETIGHLLPGTDPFLAAEIERYAGGNPLFIEELCHSAGHEDLRRRLGRLLGTGAWLNVLIESRVARLPERQAEIVRAAAVIGTVIPTSLLAELTGCAADDPLVTGLAEQDLIFPAESPGMLRFKHGITRDVIYDAVGLHQRREMHRRIAALLQRGSAYAGEEESYEALAYHFASGGDAEAAARYAELAGDKAMAASALDRAQLQYRSALTAIDSLPDTADNFVRWVGVLQRFGFACVFDPAREQLEILRRAVARARARRDDHAVARTEYWLGYVAYALGESREALAHCEQALAAAEAVGDQALVVQVQATLGQTLAAACDYDRALGLLDAALDVKRRQPSSRRPPVAVAYSLACKGAVLGHRGRFADAHACFEEALAAVRGAHHEVEGSVLCWRAAVYLWQGHWADALQCAVAAQQIARRVKTLYVFGMSRAIAGYAQWMSERRNDGLQSLLDATAWLEARDKNLFISLNYGWLGDALVEARRFAEARRYCARALARARNHDRLGEAAACRALARCALAGHAGRPPAFYLARARRAACELGSPLEEALNDECEAALLASADLDTAAALVHQAAAAFASLGMVWHQADAERRLRALLATPTTSATEG
jgi:class 3 adenylate cyclase